MEVTVPEDYLAALPDNTLAKIEVGAIGAEDNATFTEEGDICVNDTGGDEASSSRSAYSFIAYPLGVDDDDEGGCGEDDDD